MLLRGSLGRRVRRASMASAAERSGGHAEANLTCVVRASITNRDCTKRAGPLAALPSEYGSRHAEARSLSRMNQVYENARAYSLIARTPQNHPHSAHATHMRRGTLERVPEIGSDAVYRLSRGARLRQGVDADLVQSCGIPEEAVHKAHPLVDASRSGATV